MEDALKKGRSHIYSALLKYGHSNFSITILEYCSPEKCIEREDFYLYSLNHEYNIANKAGAPFTGRKHSKESIQIMSETKKGENNPMFGKTGENCPMFGKNHSPETLAKIPSQQIEVFDLKENTTIIYYSIREAARALDILPSAISNYFARNQQKPYKGQYTFHKIKAQIIEKLNT
jgi:group I intron endonuclease